MLRAPLLRAIVIGAGWGVLGFALESAGILRDATAGVHMDLRGAQTALLEVVRPQLLGIFARVVLVYLVAGMTLGAIAGLLAWVWRARGWRAWLLVNAELAALLALLVWAKAIHRPALFDDVGFCRLPLIWLMDHGEPWHPVVAAGLWLSVHAFLLSRSGRRTACSVLGVAALALAVPLVPRPTPPPRPLFVLIGIDAFRPDRLKAMGASREVAPNLDRFLNDATLFTQAYTPIAQTQPAWRSLLTARWPSRTGVRYPLPAPERRLPLETFAARFAEGGFEASFSTDCSRFNYQDDSSGFTRREQPPPGAINFVLEKLRYRGLGLVADNALGAWLVPEFIENRALAGVYDPLGYAERLGDHWADLAQQRRAFLAVHTTAAHFPGDPVYPFYRKFVDSSTPIERRARMQFAPLERGSRSSGTLEDAEGLYDELQSEADAQLGAILSALRNSSLYDEATIVVFSDHGESFHADFPALVGSTPVHGARLGEEENRILLAIKLPRSAQAPLQGKQVPQLVRIIDIGPTLLDLAGMPPLSHVEGKSLVPLLRGESTAPLTLYAETGFTHASPDVFDPTHFKGVARSLEIYSVDPDGTVKMSDEAHRGALREKDTGAFDGKTWLIRSPGRDGTLRRFCRGVCPAPDLEAWLERESPAAMLGSDEDDDVSEGFWHG